MEYCCSEVCNRESDSQLKRERSAFQGRIRSKDEAANNLIRMKMHRISLQTFFSLRREAADWVGGEEGQPPELS